MKKRIELHAKSKYSIDNESTLDIKSLILKCASNGEAGVAIVDSGSVLGFYKAEKVFKELNISDFKLVYGAELNVSYLNEIYKVVVLIKNKKGVKVLFREMSYYSTNKVISLERLIELKDNFVLGLICDENYDNEMIQYFDYVEVDKNISKKVIDDLKKKITVVYSNRINCLTSEEELSKKVLYSKINKKEKIENRCYQSTEEVMNEINDSEIVIDNSNKIFDMIDNFEIINDDVFLPDNDGFDIDLLVYIALNEKYSYVDSLVRIRVHEELKLIHEYNYDGYINIYKKIVDKCNEENEPYVICDYINYLFVAYLLGITRFDPIKMNMNYDMFFSHHARISMKLSEEFSSKMNKYIKNDLGINTIRCKGTFKLNSIMLNKAFDKYEIKENIKITSEQKIVMMKYLDDYPINNNAITTKEIVIPRNVDIFDFTPRSFVSNSEELFRVTNIDYKDIENNFMIIEFISCEDLSILYELKGITNYDCCDYENEKIINGEDYKNYLKSYDKFLVLDDLYDDLIRADLDLPDVFNVINEIRSDGTISKKTKDMLDMNNIKLSRYHDINFINRGILNERLRLKYELLYYKEYFSLEYYYVMIKDCMFNELIEIVRKGYDEIINKIKDYSEYMYEYNYLMLIKEMFEAGINFEVQERMLIENYYFELDKENDKIVLVINKVYNVVNKYLCNDISVIGTRPHNGKIEYISKIVRKLLDLNKSIFLITLDGTKNYYVEYFLSEITGIDRVAINQYMEPCSFNKKKVFHVDANDYINGVKYLLYHDLFIEDYHGINDMIIDKADNFLEKFMFIIKKNNSKIVLVDSIHNIDNLEDFLIKIKELSKNDNIRFILFSNLRKEFEDSRDMKINMFENYELIDKHINYINILDREEIVNIKE